MNPRARIILGLVLVVGILTYAVVVDLGLNAGRIHRGVTVGGVDVGGLTPSEAEIELSRRADQLSYALLSFSRGDVVCRFSPREVGWQADEAATARAAHSVGRDGPLLTSAVKRLRAWFGGVKVRWKVSLEGSKLDRTVERCGKLALAQGLTLDKQAFRKKIKTVVVQWPRRPYKMPVVESA